MLNERTSDPDSLDTQRPHLHADNHPAAKPEPQRIDDADRRVPGHSGSLSCSPQKRCADNLSALPERFSGLDEGAERLSRYVVVGMRAAGAGSGRQPLPHVLAQLRQPAPQDRFEDRTLHCARRAADASNSCRQIYIIFAVTFYAALFPSAVKAPNNKGAKGRADVQFFLRASFVDIARRSDVWPVCY
jgi:hypothetical protein